jgi:hypothetical protein
VGGETHLFYRSFLHWICGETMRPMPHKSATSTALVRRPSVGTTLGNQEVIEAEVLEDVRASTSNTGEF